MTNNEKRKILASIMILLLTIGVVQNRKDSIPKETQVVENNEILDEDLKILSKQKSFTKEELEILTEAGIVINKRYGFTPSYRYYIEVPNGTNNRSVPNGYKMYEEVLGTTSLGDNTILYKRTGNYRSIENSSSKIKKL